ncbi:MAG: NAD(P)/FAD-dependent oxidoreductase [bacterium]
MLFNFNSNSPKKHSSSDRPRVVVVGAGFGGTEIVRQFRNEPVEVMLIDRHNYHTFQPLLYQVVTAGLEPEEIAWSVRDIFQGVENFSFRMATVTDVDFESRQVIVNGDDPIDYDYLVLAAGASTDYFGVDGAEEHSYSLKNLMNAMNLRSHILEQFEKVEKHPELIDQGGLNFVIVGGGPTGVETAGALVELFKMVLQKDFPDIDVDQARVILVEMNEHLLDPYDESLRQYTLDTLRNRGVEVLLEKSVVKAEEDYVELNTGETIQTQSLIWAAGVRANPLADRLDVSQTRNGRIQVRKDLRLPDQPNVFVIGDMAGNRNSQGELDPQLAPVAIQGARHTTTQILNLEAGLPTESFEYDPPGKMATVGINAAVAELPGGIKLSGFPAWVIWVFLHIMKLVGFRNRLLVFFDWVYNYFTYDRAARLIMDVEPESDRLEDLEVLESESTM